MGSVAITGAGVAGPACAILLRVRDWQVVFDKVPRPAPLDSGLILQTVGLHVLDSMGVRMGWSIAARPAVQAGTFLFQWLPTGRWRDSTLRERHGGRLVLHGPLPVATVPVLLLGQLALAMLKSALGIGLVGRRSGGTAPD